MDIIEIIKLCGAVAGAIITLVTFFGLITKKPKKWLQNLIKETVCAGGEEIKQSLNEINKKLEMNNITSLNLLRHNITYIYEKYKDEECFPEKVKEDVCKMYEDYDRRGGNSYIHQIYDEMMKWHTR